MRTEKSEYLKGVEFMARYNGAASDDNFNPEIEDFDEYKPLTSSDKVFLVVSAIVLLGIAGLLIHAV